MSIKLRDPAQDHIDAIHQLVQYLLERCVDRFDGDMDQRIKSVFESFEQFRNTRPPYEEPRDILLDDSLGRNYMIAQCSVLAAFANEVESLVRRHQIGPLVKPLECLREELRRKYEMFFSEPAPAPANSA